jgi:hypothetical protein
MLEKKKRREQSFTQTLRGFLRQRLLQILLSLLLLLLEAAAAATLF